jgi:hypothetical protein
VTVNVVEAFQALGQKNPIGLRLFSTAEQDAKKLLPIY